MTPIKHYKLSVALPIVLPLVLVCGVLLRELLGFPLAENNPLRALSFLLIASLAMGGVPYVVLVAMLLRIFRHKSADWYPKFSFILPMLFAAMMGVVGTILELVSDGRRDVIGTGLVLAGFSLVFGCAYVFLAHAGYSFLHRIGFIQEDPVV